MCTAATYKTKDFYMGRTLDYEFSYGDEVTVTPRNYPINFRFMGVRNNHFAMIGMAHVADDYPLYYRMDYHSRSTYGSREAEYAWRSGNHRKYRQNGDGRI